jgi:hypothetical protein
MMILHHNRIQTKGKALNLFLTILEDKEVKKINKKRLLLNMIF